jgi:hypothetical protein
VHKIASRAKIKGIARLEFRETRTRPEAKAFEWKKPQGSAGRALGPAFFLCNSKPKAHRSKPTATARRANRAAVVSAAAIPIYAVIPREI